MDGWVAVLGAVGALAVTVGGVLGAWWLRIMSKRADIRSADERQASDLKASRTEDERKYRREDAGVEKKERRDLITEQRETIEMLKANGAEDRQLVHKLRDQLQTLGIQVAVAETKLAACIADRVEQHAHAKRQDAYLAVIVQRLKESGMDVQLPPSPALVPPSPPPAPPKAEGGS